MSKELVTRGDSLKGIVLSEVLASIYLPDSKISQPVNIDKIISIDKIRLMIAARFLAWEYKISAQTPISGGRVEMGKDTLGTVLYDYIVKKYGKRGEIYILKEVKNEYARQQLKKLGAVSKEEVQGVAVPPLYTDKFFETPHFLELCGKLELDDETGHSDDTFINFRLATLFSFPKILRIIFYEILGPIKQNEPNLSAPPDDLFVINYQKLPISNRDYLDFNIKDILGDVDLIITQMMEKQFSYLGDYLDHFKTAKTEKMIIALKNMWREFASLPEENLKSISIWIYVLIRITADLEKNSATIHETAQEKLGEFIISITPKLEQDLKPPSRESLSNSVTQYFKHSPILNKIFSLNFSKQSSEIYYKYFFSNKSRLESQKAVLGKMRDAKIDDYKSTVVDKGMSDLDIASMVSNLPDDLRKPMSQKLRLTYDFQYYHEELAKVMILVSKNPSNTELMAKRDGLKTSIQQCENKIEVIKKVLPYLESNVEIKSQVKNIQEQLEGINTQLKKKPLDEKELNNQKKLLVEDQDKLLKKLEINNQSIEKLYPNNQESLYGLGSSALLAKKSSPSVLGRETISPIVTGAHTTSAP